MTITFRIYNYEWLNVLGTLKGCHRISTLETSVLMARATLLVWCYLLGAKPEYSIWPNGHLSRTKPFNLLKAYDIQSILLIHPSVHNTLQESADIYCSNPQPPSEIKPSVPTLAFTPRFAGISLDGDPRGPARSQEQCERRAAQRARLEKQTS